MTTTAAVLACVCGVLALLVGERIRSRLAAGVHRRDTDEPDPVPRFPWLPWACALGAAVPAAVGTPVVQVAAAGSRDGLPVVLSGLLGGTVVLVGAAASAIDVDVHRLPNRLTLPTAAVVLTVLALVALVTGDWSSFTRAVLAAASLWAAFWVLAFLTAGGIGLGDAKLALSTGLLTGWLGWGPFLLAAWGAFAVGAVAALVLMFLGRATRTTHVPFGPSMVLATWACWVLTLAR
ncbi:prepilin peptidase [Kytococcus sp. Marseille-QA3725]